MHPRYLLSTAALITSLAACSDLTTVPVADLSQSPCKREVEISLEQGQSQTLDSKQASCIYFPAGERSEYVIAAVDGTRLVSSRFQPEKDSPADTVTYTVHSIGRLSHPSPSVASRSLEPLAPTLHQGGIHILSHAGPTMDDFFQRNRSWAEGERFPVVRIDRKTSATARVVRIYQNRYVVAIVEEDEGRGTSRFISDLDEAMRFFLEVGLPQMNSVWGTRHPTTSPQSQQLLILLEGWDPEKSSGVASTQYDSRGSGIWSVLRLNLNIRGNHHRGYAVYETASYRLFVLAHEFAHAWQFRYLYEQQSGGSRRMAWGPKWALEGVANYLAIDLVRKHLGIGAEENFKWSRHGYGSWALAYTLEPRSMNQGFTSGYYAASSFLRDIQARLVRAGTREEVAMREIARGAVEGWHGIDESGVRRVGLAPRVSALQGTTWDPHYALLLWTASQAVDDQVTSSEFFNPFYHRAADHGAVDGWAPLAPTVAPGIEARHTVRSAAGSPWFFRVVTNHHSGVLRLTSDGDHVRWMIVRSR